MTRIDETRVRRMAERQGLQLRGSRRRDPMALDFGRWQLLDAAGSAAFSGTLTEVEQWLRTPREER